MHDSNGAETFILLCIKEVQAALPGTIFADTIGTSEAEAALNAY